MAPECFAYILGVESDDLSFDERDRTLRGFIARSPQVLRYLQHKLTEWLLRTCGRVLASLTFHFTGRRLTLGCVAYL